jgi:hypothetical protein
MSQKLENCWRYSEGSRVQKDLAGDGNGTGTYTVICSDGRSDIIGKSQI